MSGETKFQNKFLQLYATAVLLVRIFTYAGNFHRKSSVRGDIFLCDGSNGAGDVDRILGPVKKII